MNVERVQQLLQRVARDLSDPATVKELASLSTLCVGALSGDGIVTTLAIVEVDPGDLLANGAVVEVSGSPGRKGWRLN